MLLAYNTNGLAHHDPLEALELLAEIGYRGVGLTLDHGLLNPFQDSASLERQRKSLVAALARLGLRSVIETGARFLLDSRQKHEPTLMSPSAEGRGRRIEFLCRVIDLAEQLGSGCVSIWSGILREPLDDAAAFARLTQGLQAVCNYAEHRGVTIGFEPEPGMFIDTQARFAELLAQFDSPALKLTLDIGHLHCQGETPLAAQIERWGERLVNVHLEDMRAGVHEHLMFGEGEIEFRPVLAALAKIGYSGLVQVELSRHSHQGPEAARKSYEFLKAHLPDLRDAGAENDAPGAKKNSPDEDPGC